MKVIAAIVLDIILVVLLTLIFAGMEGFMKPGIAPDIWENVIIAQVLIFIVLIIGVGGFWAIETLDKD